MNRELRENFVLTAYNFLVHRLAMGALSHSPPVFLHYDTAYKLK